MERISRTSYQKKAKQRRVQLKLAKLGIGILILLICVGFLYKYQQTKQRQSEFLQQYPIRGISLSQKNNYVDFNELKNKGVSFVYLRSGQGATYIDDDFDNNYSRSVGSGLKVGVYHQYGFDSPIKKQAENLEKIATDQTGDLPFRIDIDYYGEYTKDSVDKKVLQRRVNELVKILYQKYKRPVLLKTTSDNYQALAKIPHTEFWVTDSTREKQVKYKTFTKTAPLYENGENDGRHVVVFNGNKVQWERYINKLEKDGS
ncbi:GH25 family lysozyme [Fructilactobacillus vespulae]|uniref:GH25 family lysozyme n=1 Tax=Fructilactobacillus vespulae TaxID=1249630 RepID=UPI0039B51362